MNKLQLLKIAWQDRFEYDSEFTGNYKPFSFFFRVLIAIVLKRICWNCNGHGRTGYYEPEDCNICYGFGFNWTNEQEPDWEAMVEGMRNNEDR